MGRSSPRPLSHVPRVTRGPGWMPGGDVLRVAAAPLGTAAQRSAPRSEPVPPRCPTESPAPEETLPSRPKKQPGRLLSDACQGHRSPGGTAAAGASPRPWGTMPLGVGSHGDGDGAAWVSLCQTKALPHPPPPHDSRTWDGVTGSQPCPWATTGPPRCLLGDRQTGVTSPGSRHSPDGGGQPGGQGVALGLG